MSDLHLLGCQYIGSEDITVYAYTYRNSGAISTTFFYGPPMSKGEFIKLVEKFGE